MLKDILENALSMNKFSQLMRMGAKLRVIRMANEINVICGVTLIERIGVCGYEDCEYIEVSLDGLDKKLPIEEFDTPMDFINGIHAFKNTSLEVFEALYGYLVLGKLITDGTGLNLVYVPKGQMKILHNFEVYRDIRMANTGNINHNKLMFMSRIVKHPNLLANVIFRKITKNDSKFYLPYFSVSKFTL